MGGIWLDHFRCSIPPPAVAAVCLKHRSIRFPSTIHRPVGQILPIYLQIYLPEGFLETTKIWNFVFETFWLLGNVIMIHLLLNFLDLPLDLYCSRDSRLNWKWNITPYPSPLIKWQKQRPKGIVKKGGSFFSFFLLRCPLPKFGSWMEICK